MNEVFKLLMGKLAVLYFNCILIYSTNEDEHIEHLCLVLIILQIIKLYINKQCSYMQTSLDFLWLCATGDEIRVDKEKIKVIQVWPAP